MKLPPYGKPLYELISKGFKPNNSVNLFIGHNAWKKGEAFSISYPSRTLILPPWLSSVDYFWPVKSCDMLVHDTSYSEQEYINRLVFSLYEHDADIVRVIDSKKNLIIYHKE
jgi:hypothetical protein